MCETLPIILCSVLVSTTGRGEYLGDHKPADRLERERVLDAFLVVSERFSETTADGFSGQPAAEVARRLPDGWLSEGGTAVERYPACLTGSTQKMGAVWSELGIKGGTNEARVLLGDAAEGYARGMMGNLGVGPFFAEVAAHIKRIL